ncbi:LysR family transcriptional regulator [Streptomyces sp. NPDC051452]|uniref:LysR family transcriptional regulator n=1 Tax=Streptomyces sp. NPDC051452 TaxID=3365654 RepID=UPI0037B1E94F
MIDVQRLRILRTVAEHGSFNRAAAVLRLTPSAVSQQVAALERSLGAQVVARSTRGVTLTRAGQIMVGAAESVAAELEHAQQQVAELSTGRTQLTVATFTSGGRLMLPAALTRLMAAHPRTVVHVREGEPEDTLPLVRQGAVDVALAGHDALDLAELAAEPWVLGCLKTEAYLRRYAEHAGFDPEVRGTTTDYFFARSLVAAGMGISLIPSIALAPEIPGLCTVPIKSPGPIRHIGVATISGRDRPHVMTLIRSLREQAMQHNGR